MTTQIFESFGAFLRREDKTINGVSPDFAERHPDWEADNETNRGCYNCSGCSDCYNCSRCSDCSDCYNKNSVNVGVLSQIPKINGIHSEVLRAVSEPGALDMSDWHTCDTTHCRAGWVVTLAGEEGKKLEGATSTDFAAMMIYKVSSDIRVSPVRFYEDDKVAMADIKRCAALEVEE